MIEEPIFKPGDTLYYLNQTMRITLEYGSWKIIKVYVCDVKLEFKSKGFVDYVYGCCEFYTKGDQELPDRGRVLYYLHAEDLDLTFEDSVSKLVKIIHENHKEL